LLIQVAVNPDKAAGAPFIEPEEVIKNLEEQGYHLQLQKDILVEQMLAMKAVN